MDFITYVQQALIKQLPEIIKGYEGEVRAESLSEMETGIKQMTHELGGETMKHWLEAQDEKYPSQHKPCQCGEQAQYVRRRVGTTITLQGRAGYGRAYYNCPHCHKGHYPLDQRLGIKPGTMSKEVVKMAALLGIHDAFTPGSDTLRRTTLLELSPNSVRKATQQVGEAVMADEQQQIAQSQDLAAPLAHKRDPDKPVRLYGSLDGFNVLFRDGWHEMKAGAWWVVDEQGRAQDIRYYVDMASAAVFSDLVWATGFAQKADQALELVFVADGAEWIWRIVEQHFPQAVQIVDWFHACQYLTPVAQVACKNPADQEDWLKNTRTALWEGQLDEVIAACRQHIQPNRARQDDPAQQAVTYFTNNGHRMDYPAYRANGYQIGSGTMESGCKQIGLERLKISGAQWLEDGARKVAKARAAYLSGQWDSINLQQAA
jgi:hypothetical protein